MDFLVATFLVATSGFLVGDFFTTEVDFLAEDAVPFDAVSSFDLVVAREVVGFLVDFAVEDRPLVASDFLAKGEEF